MNEQIGQRDDRESKKRGRSKAIRNTAVGLAVAAAGVSAVYVQARAINEGVKHKDAIDAQTTDAMTKDGFTITKLAYSDGLALGPVHTSADSRNIFDVSVTVNGCPLPLQAQATINEQGAIIDVHGYSLDVISEPKIEEGYSRRGNLTEKYLYFQGNEDVIYFENQQGLVEQLPLPGGCVDTGGALVPDTTIPR